MVFFGLRLGEGCSHAAAIMFKVECAVRLGHTSVTSQSCKWNEVFCKKANILPVNTDGNINIL